MSKKKLTGQQRKKKLARRRRRKKILIVVELLILLVLGVGVYAASKFNLLEVNPIAHSDVMMNEEVTKNKELKAYTNIALFGIDSRDESLGDGNRSDTIIVASINNKTKEIKMVSVYRDTYLLIPKEERTYDKANLGYFYGGPELAINELNRNLDLDITDYVSVNFSALIDTIDALGGIDVEITEKECFYINGYMTETAEITGKEKVELYESGLVHLNGMQATAFCRIRYVPTVNGTNDDYGRTERQRLVISKIAEKAKKADLLTLNKVVDMVLPNISTSLTVGEILGLISGVAKYELVDNAGFPFEKVGTGMGSKGDCVVPVDLEYNVEELHRFLFGVEDYTVSETVKEISERIVEVSGLRHKEVGVE
ncbi:MAG: LCP family protein [Lachnospiraceae bacterium]|nr:LCP family protein [Lachnospiraceae bacterium]